MILDVRITGIGALLLRVFGSFVNDHHPRTHYADFVAGIVLPVHYALCGEAPLLRELGIDTQTMRGSPLLRLETRPGSRTADLPLSLEPRRK